MTRHGPRRAPQTGLDDATVLAIILAVIRERGHLDLDAVIVRLAAERDRRRWGPRLHVVEPAWRYAREATPTGAA